MLTQIGRKHKLSARDVYPDELGVLGRWVCGKQCAVPCDVSFLASYVKHDRLSAI